MPYLVDATLITGQRLQTIDIASEQHAINFARDIRQRTMVERVDVIDTRTGECVWGDLSLNAAWWRPLDCS